MEDETLISDLAKGFLQAQAKISQDSQKNNADEVMNLLSKINNQLENLQSSLDAGSQPGSQSQQSQQSQQNDGQKSQQNQQQETGANSEAAVSQELKKLFSTLLQNNSQKNNSSGGGQSPDMLQQQQQQQQQQQNQEQITGQAQSQQNNKVNTNNITVQTAAQVLAQAQYELSNELEASLKKLKQVISESEQIANKISNLLGEENSQK